MKYLNLGCGSRFHRDWINMDAVSSDPHVQVYELNAGIPFPDKTFDVVYHSHLLEHFAKPKALGFIRECYRVLKGCGIVRVAVPDLEQIARIYVQALEKALQGQKEWQHHYEWIMLELYDQTVREYSGGAMLEYFKQDPIPNEAFVYERLGGEARRIVQALRSCVPPNRKKKRLEVSEIFPRIRDIPRRVRLKLLKMLLGESDYKALKVAQFRARGEIHRWMYDRYSLAQLLLKAGFQNPKTVGPTESQIPDWITYHLDTEPDGTIYKPDSLYMEAIKL